MTDRTQYLDAVSNGHNTAEKLADALEISYGYANRMLKDLANDGELERERDGQTFVYSIADDAGDGDVDEQYAGATDDTGDDGLMPVVRDYDWDSPAYRADPAEYFATDGELRRIQAQVANIDRTNEPVRVAVDGPTGCGKTLLAEVIAAQEDAVFITLQMTQDTTEADLIGSPTFSGDQTTWVDGPVTKALIASREHTVVLLIDEVNRAPAYAKNALFSALDHRGAVTLDGPRGGEVIQGNPQNIVTIATMNQGSEYHGTQRMDLAEKTRYTTRVSVDYLASGPNDVEGIEREAELLTKRTPVHADLARDMVTAAADIRGEANDNANRTIDAGIPTRSMLAWAARASDYNAADIDNPVIAAAEDTIVRPIFGDVGNENAYDEALGVIEDHLDGVPFEADDYDVYNEDELVTCDDCDYMAPKTEAENDGVLASATCPECGSGNIRVIQQQ